MKIRAKGAALAAAADFLGNFLVVEITPPALQNIGYKTYIIFAVLNAANAIIVWCFYPETGGQPLESIDRLFVKDQMQQQVDKSGRHFIRRLQWNVVPRAAEQRKAYKRKSSMFDEEESKSSEERVEI